MNLFVCAFTKITGWLPFVLRSRPKYYYEDKKVQSRKIRGNAIIMPNHHTIFDFAVMMFVFPFRTLRCVVSELIYDKNSGLKWFLKSLGTIRVDRSSGDFAFMDSCAQILQKGGVVEIYPESRIPLPEEERPLEFKPSITHIALTSGAPIIPVVHNGRFCQKERLRVLIGKPIDVRALYVDGMDEKEQIEHITCKLREEIIRLNHELTNKINQEKSK